MVWPYPKDFIALLFYKMYTLEEGNQSRLTAHTDFFYDDQVFFFFFFVCLLFFF